MLPGTFNEFILPMFCWFLGQGCLTPFDTSPLHQFLGYHVKEEGRSGYINKRVDFKAPAVPSVTVDGA